MPAFSQLMRLITPRFEAHLPQETRLTERLCGPDPFAGAEAGPASWVGPTQAAPAGFWLVSCGSTGHVPPGLGWPPGSTRISKQIPIWTW